MCAEWIYHWTFHGSYLRQLTIKLFTSSWKDNSYRSCDKEAREQIPEAEEKGHNNGRYLVAGSQRYNHHPIHREVDKGHEHKVVEPNKLVCFPREANHTEKEQWIDKGLHCDVEHLDAHLQDKRL